MLDYISEITARQEDLIKSFAIFFLLSVGPYVTPSLFTKTEMKYLTNSMMLQIILSFFLFSFLVTLVSSKGEIAQIPPIAKFIYSIYYFIGFLIVMQLDIRVVVSMFILIFIIYFIELNKEFYLNTTNNNANYWITLSWPWKVRMFPINNTQFTVINKVEKILFLLIVLLLVIGIIIYAKDTRIWK